uniref:Uncharacterized protein n=1 Tax=Lepeophtheirus salmonis TaxID=72036 RepID=A0A0K2TU33_LEPSM
MNLLIVYLWKMMTLEMNECLLWEKWDEYPRFHRPLHPHDHPPFRPFWPILLQLNRLAIECFSHPRSLELKKSRSQYAWTQIWILAFVKESFHDALHPNRLHLHHQHSDSKLLWM